MSLATRQPLGGGPGGGVDRRILEDVDCWWRGGFTVLGVSTRKGPAGPRLQALLAQLGSVRCDWMDECARSPCKEAGEAEKLRELAEKRLRVWMQQLRAWVPPNPERSQRE